MLLEINKLIESEIDEIRNIGWILYHENVDKGLSPEVTLKLIETLSRVDNGNLHIYTESDLEKARDDGYDDGYDEGYKDAERHYDCDCNCC